ncbi:hypothetical protein CY35_05G076600 [Sphagnum magellanicum]|nr:hypothetical protein CY35_05G076600 [Sphagnum magellanicum]
MSSTTTGRIIMGISDIFIPVFMAVTVLQLIVLPPLMWFLLCFFLPKKAEALISLMLVIIKMYFTKIYPYFIGVALNIPYTLYLARNNTDPGSVCPSLFFLFVFPIYFPGILIKCIFIFLPIIGMDLIVLAIFLIVLAIVLGIVLAIFLFTWALVKTSIAFSAPAISLFKWALVKNSTAFSVNGSTETPGPGSPLLPNVHYKVLLGAGVSGGSEDVSGEKPMVWNRSAGTEKATVVASVYVPETSSSQQRLIVRMANPGKSPALACGETVDVATPVSRSSSPNVLETHSSAGLADVLETNNNRPQAGVQAAFFPEAGADDAKAGSGGESGTGSSEDNNIKPQSNASPVIVLESEKRTSNESPHGKVGGEEEADFGSKEILTGCSGAFKSAGEASPQIGDSGKGADTASAAARIEDGPCRHPQALLMEVDDGAMSLLATPAAAAEVGGTGILERAGTGGEILNGEQELNTNTSVDARASHTVEQ